MAEQDSAELITVAQAINIIDQTPVHPRTQQVSLKQSTGLFLAEDLRADRDYPPFRKSMMDGYAVRSSDVAGGKATLRVVGQIAAGQWPDRSIGPGETMAIMTGAPVPDGADGVVPVEDVAERVPIGSFVHVLRAKFPGRFIVERGSDCPAGKAVLTRGMEIGAAQAAVAASIGAAQLRCFARPRVAILGTGDEIVPIAQTPGPAQIRDSNTHMLTAILCQLGCEVANVETVRDEKELLRAAIGRAMAHDALFITGGMSMGEFDYVPRLLQEMNMDMRITKLRMKPGKPFVFTVGKNLAPDAKSADTDRLNPPFVFGLPGNPVSAFVCTVRLASRLMMRLAGGKIRERWTIGRLESSLSANGPREFYQPARVICASGNRSTEVVYPTIIPLAWKGSADLFTLAGANALIVRTENEASADAGTLIRVMEI